MMRRWLAIAVFGLALPVFADDKPSPRAQRPLDRSAAQRDREARPVNTARSDGPTRDLGPATQQVRPGTGDAIAQTARRTPLGNDFFEEQEPPLFRPLPARRPATDKPTMHDYLRSLDILRDTEPLGPANGPSY